MLWLEGKEEEWCGGGEGGYLDAVGCGHGGGWGHLHMTGAMGGGPSRREISVQ